MAKIKIAQNPTFKADVEIPRIGDKPVTVWFEFKYLDRVALSALFDKWNVALTELATKVKDEDLSWMESTAAEVSLQAEQIKDIVLAWGFDEEFTGEAIAELVQTCVEAPRVVLDTYRAAYAPARLGN